MWRNVYRLPDGSYEFGMWFFDKIWTTYVINTAPGAVRVGRMRAREHVRVLQGAMA